MNSHHGFFSRVLGTATAACIAVIHCVLSGLSFGATPTPPLSSTAIVSAASPMPASAQELTSAQPAEPVYEIRAAIPVIRVPSMAEPMDLSKVGSYAGHTVRRNETLESIAAQAGCTPQLLGSYNKLVGPLQVGRQIIVPLPAAAVSEMPSRPVLVERGQTSHPLVALTFDAGSTAEPLPKLLQTLRDHQLKVTFFVTGFWVRENPDLLKQIVADGHELGNHSLTHPDMRHLDDMRIKHEILETERLVLKTAGVSARPYFRPPYGAYNDRVLLASEALGYLPIYWTLDCLDSVGAKKSPDFIADRVTRKLSREQLCGSIVLMHVDSMATADAVPEILSRFDDMGLSVVTVSRVLNEEGIKIPQTGLSSR
ncbi:MAG: polysaccharide deacetylase [Verrucomicrobiaceae bacterium]|nr:polysaccharide deacetylase [Verrucomicrobiaceae bacterium]